MSKPKGGQSPLDAGGASRTGTDPVPAAAVGFTVYTLVMLIFERRMRRTGGPGIIAFELAGNATRAGQIMNSWGHVGQRAARWSLRLDFGYMLTYGTLTALLIDRTRRHHGHAPALPLLVVPAVGADAIEGLSLLNVLHGNSIAINARRARIAALVKFAILAAALAYVLGWATIERLVDPFYESPTAGAPTHLAARRSTHGAAASSWAAS
jgi:hypothetical protein